jgi:hypothetical protein
VCIQGTLQREDGQPLGTPASVQQSLRVVFPDVAFDWSPTGWEKLASLDARGIALPEMVRRALEQQPSFICGHVECESYEVTFNLGTDGPVERIWVQVSRGVAQVSHCWEILSMSTGWKLSLEGD